MFGPKEDGVNDYVKARFAGGGELAFNLYVSPAVAVNLGMGLVGKGYRFELTAEETGTSFGIKQRISFLAMDLPVGVLFNFAGFHLGIDMVMSFLLSGKEQTEIEGEEIEADIDNWDGTRRFNIGPRVSLGYAIPAGPMAIVPGFFWEMDLINVIDLDDEIMDEFGSDIDSDISYRHMNIMGTLGIEFGL